MKIYDFFTFLNEGVDIERIKSRELQKIRLIPLDNISSRSAISNIIDSEVRREKFDFDRTIESLLRLDLSKTKIRNQFRFNDYYKRFYKSRTRGFGFEGLIGGLLGYEISESLSSPYDIFSTENGNKISCKVVRDKTESIVLKGISYSLREYLNTYTGSDENRNFLESIIGKDNPISFLLSTRNDDHVNVAEDLIDYILKEIDGVIIGIPKMEYEIDIYYFEKSKIKNLLLIPGMTIKPKTKGASQIRLSSKVFNLIDKDLTPLRGTIKFPIISDENYEKFLLGNEETKEVLINLNRFGKKYGVSRFGDNIPQDIISDLSKNKKFLSNIKTFIDYND
jgi:hypothetical protein